MNKTEQKLTKQIVSKRDPQTGLTPIQEQCALMMVTGERITFIADKLQVSRSVIYQWCSLVTFQCFMNQLRDEMKRQFDAMLLALSSEAMKAVSQTLASENEALRFKAATWVLGKLDAVEVGECDPFNAVREESTFFDKDYGCKVYHPDKYQKRLNDLGLEEEKS